MGDIAGTVSESLEHARESQLNAIVAAMVAITATFMALCNVKDGNVVQAMQQAQANGVDAWAYYQAKSTKQHLAEQMIDLLTIQRDAIGNLTDDGKVLIDKRIAGYKTKAKTYDKEKNEIRKKAEGYQKQYDELNLHDDQFDMAEAALSISIALFGVTALTQKRWLLAISGFFFVFGFFIGFAGFLGKSVHPDFLAKILS